MSWSLCISSPSRTRVAIGPMHVTSILHPLSVRRRQAPLCCHRRAPRRRHPRVVAELGVCCCRRSTCC
jgi:hypothetical protein